MDYLINKAKNAMKIIGMICMFLVLIQCVTYKFIKFIPETKTEPFENWNIEILFDTNVEDFAVENDFLVSFCVSTYKEGWGTKEGTYKKSIYKAKIKSFKIFHGDGFNNEITNSFHKIDTSWAPGEKEQCIESKHSIILPGNIYQLKIVAEIEYISEDNKSITKKYSIPMERKDTSVPFFEMK